MIGAAPPCAPCAPFRLLDLGCGAGAGLIVMAAAYPEGRFTGVDAMPTHVAHGEALAARLGLGNVTFRRALFADVEAAPFPEQDYVIAQGVIAWVSPANRAHVYRIAAGALRPDGVAVFGYNAMPGWKDIAVLQHMVHAMAETESGPPERRFDAAVERLRTLDAAGAAGFSDGLWTWFDGAHVTLPPGYFHHEYLNQHWAPQWSDQVARAMAAHGFARTALANANRQRDDFAFRVGQRRALDDIADPVARELAEDAFLNASFRVDVFARTDRVGAPQARLDGWRAATVADADEEYGCDTPADRLKFDNAAAHAILVGLASGPQSLCALHARGGGGTEADIPNAADALFAGGYVAPAEPPAATPFARHRERRYRAAGRGAAAGGRRTALGEAALLSFELWGQVAARRKGEGKNRTRWQSPFTARWRSIAWPGLIGSTHRSPWWGGRRGCCWRRSPPRSSPV